MKPTEIDRIVAILREAAAHEPIDWDVIRGECLTLDGHHAQTEAERKAVHRLRAAEDRTQLRFAISAVERAFLDGKPGLDGWPRRL